MFPESPPPVARAAAGVANVTLKQSVLFGVVVVLKVPEVTVHVTMAPVFPSTIAWALESVSVPGKKMMGVPDVASWIRNVPATGSVIVTMNVAVFVTPPTVMVAVTVAVPGVIPVMIPVVPTVATAGVFE